MTEPDERDDQSPADADTGRRGQSRPPADRQQPATPNRQRTSAGGNR